MNLVVHEMSIVFNLISIKHTVVMRIINFYYTTVFVSPLKTYEEHMHSENMPKFLFLFHMISVSQYPLSQLTL